MLWVEATPTLDFTYLGAVKDGDGFTYALYEARPKHPDGPNAPTSLWRIDLDPEGRVIWAEFARLFDQPRVELMCGDSASLPHPSLSILSLVRLSGGLGHAWALPGHVARSQDGRQIDA